MNDPPRFIVPASAAPGQDLVAEARRTPDGVVFFRIYTIAVAVFDLAIMVFGYWMIIAPALHPTVRPEVASLLTGIVWTFLSGSHLIACLVALVGGRRPWVHTLGFVLVIASLMSCCFTPFAIFVLIAYNRPEVKHYYSDG